MRGMEQRCPDCARWEAAHAYCSWCFRRMGPEDWYRSKDAAERARRLRPTPPASVPSEYVNTNLKGGWPPEWGPAPTSRRSE